MACKCYHAERNFIGKIGVCWGTKECEACSCGGDEAKCDFYDYVRERAKNLSQKQTNADNLRASTDEELAEFFEKILDCESCFIFKNECGRDGYSCNQRITEWLKEEVQDG